MKKTIIALMALAGVAVATEYSNDDFGTWYSEAIADTSYKAGDDYTLSFTLGTWPHAESEQSVGHISGMIITLTENWGLFTQGGHYLAFDVTSTQDRGGLTTSTGSYTSSNTSEATGALAQGTEGWFYTYGAQDRQADTVFTITRSNGVDSITIKKNATSIASFTITGDNALDASTFKIPDIYPADNPAYGFNVQSAVFTANGVTSDISTPAPTIPEPTTATLSLLALAGLAARRRRH